MKLYVIARKHLFANSILRSVEITWAGNLWFECFLNDGQVKALADDGIEARLA